MPCWTRSVADTLGVVLVCCGPRCGTEPGHRAVYAAAERAAGDAGYETAPAMCRGVCYGGVTVVLPGADGISRVEKVSGGGAAKERVAAALRAPEGLT